MGSIGGHMAKQEPELLTATAEGFGRAINALTLILEILCDIEILRPGRRHGDIIAVFFFEGGLIGLIFKQVDTVTIGVHVAVHRLRQNFAIPDHQRIAINGRDIFPIRPFPHRRRHLGQIGGSGPVPCGGKSDHVKRVIAAGEGGHKLGIEFRPREFDDLDRTAGFFSAQPFAASASADAI